MGKINALKFLFTYRMKFFENHFLISLDESSIKQFKESWNLKFQGFLNCYILLYIIYNI